MKELAKANARYAASILAFLCGGAVFLKERSDGLSAASALLIGAAVCGIVIALFNLLADYLALKRANLRAVIELVTVFFP